MPAEDFEENYMQMDKDMLCVFRKLIFMLIAILITGILSYLAGGIGFAIIAVLCVVGTTAGIELIDDWSDDYGEDNKDL